MRAVDIFAFAKAPHLNFPGKMLAFNLQGRRGRNGVEPDELAASIRYDLETLYLKGG